jgi:myo-inositol 2-dehydrogenase/D-chiro-inositol 1-dehydrogenase
MGSDHIERIRAGVAGATVAGVFDTVAEKRSAFENQFGYRAFESFEEMVRDPRIDAIIVATPGPFHPKQILACIDAGKPCLSEKPLAPTSTEALDIIRVESSKQRRMVQLGFMRRYDRAFANLRTNVRSGSIGQPLVIHCVHRNPTVRPGYESLNALNDSITHEIDIVRWLLDEEIAAVRVVLPRSSELSPGLQDPKIVLLETQSGIVVTIEIFVTCQYGYDVRCEVVGSRGVANISTVASHVSVLSKNSQTATITANWSERFGESYARELMVWVASVSNGEISGPSAWDGYAASFVAEQCVRSLQIGERVAFDMAATPEIYRQSSAR